MIGSSDGKAYESEMDVALGRPIEPPEKATGASKSDLGTKTPDTLPGMQDYPKGFNIPDRMDRETPPIIDREHHVPLVASALTDDSGKMYGMAIDHRIPPKPEYEKHLINHEAYENDYMNDLVKNGMSSQDAYHKAHDWSTARESAAVTAEFGEKGLEDYKQHWRDASSIASEPSEMPRHPDAHTTRHGLDESELGRSFPTREAIFRGLKGAGITKNDADFKPPDPVRTLSPRDDNKTVSPFGGKTLPMSWSSAPSEQKWFKGADGKWRQEIPDAKAEIKPAIKNIDLPFSERVKNPIPTLGDILHHPELFKSYPDLKDIKVSPTHPSWGEATKGGVSKDGSVLYLKVGMSEADSKSTLLHEIQHLIQIREGFVRGTNISDTRKVVDQAIKNTGIPGQGMEDAAAFQAYRHVAGEVEARNVQTRMNWPPEALDIFPPELTEDVPRSKQLNPPK